MCSVSLLLCELIMEFLLFQFLGSSSTTAELAGTAAQYVIANGNEDS